MSHSTIRLDIAQGVATVTLDRPDKLNAFTDEMHGQLGHALDRIEIDRAVRAVLLTGTGRAFCAGQDLGDRAMSEVGRPVDLGDTLERLYNPLIRRIAALDRPVVCAVNGVAAGAGATLALACDVVLAARSASFVQAFCKVGLVPDAGGTWHLPRHVGLPRAMGMALLGEPVPAEQAEAWGLIWRCLDDARLMGEAQALAHHLARQATLGLGLTKQALRAAFDHTLEQQLELEARLQRQAGSSEDHREGVAAFLAKREPIFKGR